jgi:hypothetical protein
MRNFWPHRTLYQLRDKNVIHYENNTAVTVFFQLKGFQEAEEFYLSYIIDFNVSTVFPETSSLFIQ